MIDALGYYSDFRKEMKKLTTVSDNTEFIIPDSSQVKSSICNKIFNLLLNDVFKNIDDIDDEHKKLLNEYLEETDYKFDPTVAHISDDAKNFTVPFHHAYVESNLFLKAVIDNGHIIIQDIENVMGLDELSVIISMHFIDDMTSFKQDCIDCCDTHNNIMKIYIMYLMTKDLQSKGKDKETMFFIKYILCLINQLYGTSYSMYKDAKIGYDISTNKIPIVIANE